MPIRELIYLMNDDRFGKAAFATWLGIIVNLILAILKGIIGYISNSKALIADAAHSASDVVGSIAVLIGIRAAQKPPDDDHPYGHGKAESIAAIVVSVILLLIGIEIAINSGKSIVAGVSAPPHWYALIAIFISIVSKEVLFQYKIRLGRQISSQAVIANAWEHRSDVYSSVAALLAVAGALLGQKLEITWLYYLDPVAGIIVAALIIQMGYKLVMESIHYTMDHVLHDEEAEELVHAVQQVAGVIDIDDLRAREHGHYVIVDIKISVNPHISVHEGHDIARAVKNELMMRFSHVSDVFVHVNPYEGSPYDNNDNNMLH